jgi:septin family protein
MIGLKFKPNKSLQPVFSYVSMALIISVARLRMLDVAAMRKLHKKVNLVPVIGKADSLTTAELGRFKSQVLQELKQYEIQVCLFSQLKTNKKN